MTSAGQRIFLLSPANSSGRRAGYLMGPHSQMALAQRLRRGEKVPLGELFTFMSQLYFRGKLAYAAAFANPPADVPGSLIITPTRGLVPANEPFGLDDLRELGQTAIDYRNEEYRQPLLNSGLRLAQHIGDSCQVILLGSIASQKYVELLVDCFGRQLYFPGDFVGRGDMSRGGLLLRAAESGTELAYTRVGSAPRRGTRPARLDPPSPKGADD